MCAANPRYAEELQDRVERMVAVRMLQRTSPELPTSIGPYKVLGHLGEGGMGMVLLAEQRTPVRRRVAIKVIKLGMDTKAVLSRFELEKQALAVMNHPAIAKVFDAGATEQGQPYFAMELVEGVPLNHYCDEHRLPIEDRIRILQQVCRGVQHAHQKGVLHRDLKPANVLASGRQGEHIVKIIDFGLARATNHQLVDETIFTEHGQLLGTPEYMSPEQAGGSSHEIDTRTDIYSLGVMLYELLAGALPLSSQELRSSSANMQLKLREHQPSKPSDRVSTLAGETDLSQQRCHTTTTLRKALRGDLDWIVMRAIAKEPDRRYGSATELMQDLSRYLDHEPVLAGPPSASYRLGKLIEKHRIEFVAGLLVFVILVVATVGSTWSLLNARESERIALDQMSIAKNEISRFDQLALTVRLDEAVEDLRNLIQVNASKSTLSAWIAEGEQLAVDLQTALDSLAEHSPPTDKSASSDAAVRNRFVQSALSGAEQRIAEFTGPNGALAQARVRQTWLTERERPSHTAEIRERWDRARDALRLADGTGASTLYGPKHHPDHPINLQPQEDLIPIGTNPKTKLLEFYHLRSAWAPGKEFPTIPVHDEHGQIEVAADTGIIFVLLPGATVHLGAQSGKREGPLFDQRAANKNPAKLWEIAPMFIARHEMTQGQWLNLCRTTPLLRPEGISRERWLELSTGGNPSLYPTPLNRPVEMVSWHMANDLLSYFRLRLPTSKEWEYAGRAGATTPWHTGSTGESLSGSANVFDKQVSMPWDGPRANFNDGFKQHSPVGVLKPNAFGLHDVHGNVWEYCLNLLKTGDTRYRGGSFGTGPIHTRFGNKRTNTPTMRSSYCGIRSARSLDKQR